MAMRRGQKINLVMGVAALALLGLAVLTKKAPEAGGPPLTVLNRDQIARIELGHPLKDAIVLEKRDGTWRLTAPVAVEADRFAVASLLGFANAETRSALDAKDLKLGDLGLDPPRYLLKLDSTELAFGDVEPLKYTRYVAVKEAGATRYATIDDSGGTATDADYSDLVSRSLLPEAAVVTAIEVPGLKIAKAATGPGWASEPANVAASSDAIQKFVDAWREAKSLFNQAPAKDAKPAAETATVTLADGSKRVFGIVARTPQLVLSRDDLKLQYTLAATEVDRLLTLPPEKAPEKSIENPATGTGGTPVPDGAAPPAPSEPSKH